MQNMIYRLPFSPSFPMNVFVLCFLRLPYALELKNTEFPYSSRANARLGMNVVIKVKLGNSFPRIDFLFVSRSVAAYLRFKPFSSQTHLNFFADFNGKRGRIQEKRVAEHECVESVQHSSFPSGSLFSPNQ